MHTYIHTLIIRGCLNAMTNLPATSLSGNQHTQTHIKRLRHELFGLNEFVAACTFVGRQVQSQLEKHTFIRGR